MNEENPRGAPSELQRDCCSPDYSAGVPHTVNHSEGFLHNLSGNKTVLINVYETDQPDIVLSEQGRNCPPFLHNNHTQILAPQNLPERML